MNLTDKQEKYLFNYLRRVSHRCSIHMIKILIERIKSDDISYVIVRIFNLHSILQRFQRLNKKGKV